MASTNLDFHVILIMTLGLALAGFLGYLSHRLKLSPILGYLIAGYLIGPYSPGLVADLAVAEQLSEIGIVLMLFSVGLHFKWQDLVSVKNIAIPGAIGHIFISTVFAVLVVYLIGWDWEAGIIFGICIGVTSTMVLMRVLSHHHILQTMESRIAIGWLIVEDLLVILVLLLLPMTNSFLHDATVTWQNILLKTAQIVGKFIALWVIMFTIGLRLVKYVLAKIDNTQSRELFTLAILALTFTIALGSAYLFDTSIALGAFIAGMVIGQTDVTHKVTVSSTPLKDIFVVIFFIAIGMLFNPMTIVNHYFLFLGILAIILLIKPLSGWLISSLLKHPTKTALTVALALAQIGEFSFILAESAVKLNILPSLGYNILVACSIVSIAVNPLLFKLVKR